ncbi:MAG: TolC family protein, partial [Gelidibacter sp.]
IIAFDEDENIQTIDHQLGFWKEEAKQNAKVLQEVDLQILQAESGEKLAKSEKLPQVFAFAGNYLNGPVMIEIPVLNKNFNYWNVGIGMKYNVSSIFKSKAKIKQVQISISNALENKEIVTNDLNHEIETAEIRWHESEKIYQTHLKSVELASQNYSVISNRFLNDMALTTEMLEAENTKLDAELKAENSKINILFHYYQLRKLTGTL